ncbi:hypothetical protein VNI00_017782 [Paramarasmius palmivorus]|uniref:Uncharacterized protein n=1 Tax=Paramarasmius palmivorus TaxID=297713 RepID=A0AAW0B2C1_9AGAR
MKLSTTSIVVFALLAHASAQNVTLPGSGEQQVQNQCESQANAMLNAIKVCSSQSQQQSIIDCLCSDNTSDTIGVALNCAVSADGSLLQDAQKAFDQYSQNCQSDGKEVKQQTIRSEGNGAMGLHLPGGKMLSVLGLMMIVIVEAF